MRERPSDDELLVTVETLSTIQDRCAFDHSDGGSTGKSDGGQGGGGDGLNYPES